MTATRSRFVLDPRVASLPWVIKERDGDWKFADGTPVCLIMDAEGGVVAYDVGYPEARFIIDAIEALTDEPARGSATT